MEQYIPKAPVVAEIKRILSAFENSDAPVDRLRASILIGLLSFINTLEVKEVPIWEKVSPDTGQTTLYKDGGKSYLERFGYRIDLKDLDKLPKKNLKAQKGEIWQVIDNVNHPQADKNKIYCVFTKNRYILATVINHPKDEELLQWKCTEFPHHRYDMCEGDKYMQIV